MTSSWSWTSSRSWTSSSTSSYWSWTSPSPPPTTFSSSSSCGSGSSPQRRPLTPAQRSSRSVSVGALCWVLPLEEEEQQAGEESPGGGEGELKEVSCCLYCRWPDDGAALLVTRAYVCLCVSVCLSVCVCRGSCVLKNRKSHFFFGPLARGPGPALLSNLPRRPSSSGPAQEPVYQGDGASPIKPHPPEHVPAAA